MVVFRSKDEIYKIHESCKRVREVLDYLEQNIAEGIKTKELNSLAEKKSAQLKGVPAFKGYSGFPASVCISLNEEVVHGIPGDRVIKNGDIVKVDFGLIYQGYYGDAAFTKIVGKVADSTKKLVEITKESLAKGIEAAVDGNRIGDIGFAVQTFVENSNFNVVRAFVGHGIGRALHEEPQVPNYGKPKSGHIIKKGLVIAIEPMVNEGTYEVDIKRDGWTVVTQDRKMSAHFEHTIAVTENGAVILTK